MRSPRFYFTVVNKLPNGSKLKSLSVAVHKWRSSHHLPAFSALCNPAGGSSVKLSAEPPPSLKAKQITPQPSCLTRALYCFRDLFSF